MAAATSQNITLWDLGISSKPQVILGHGGAVPTLAFAPDSTYLVTGHGDAWRDGPAPPDKGGVVIKGFEPGPGAGAAPIKLWNFVTGKSAGSFADHRVQVLAFAPDGKTLVTGGDRLILRDASTRAVKFHLDGHRAKVSAVAFSKDSSLLVSGSRDGVVKLWDVAAGKEKASWIAHPQNIVTSLALCRDGKILASGGGQPMHSQVPPGEHMPGGGIRVGPISSSSGAVKLWNLDSQQEIHTIPSNTSVLSIAFSSAGDTLVVASEEHKVLLWDMAAMKQRGALHSAAVLLEGHRGPVHAVAYAQDGNTLATASADGTVKIWDPVTGQLRATLAGEVGALRCLAFAPSGSALAAGSSTGNTLCWHTGTQLPDVPLAKEVAKPSPGFDAHVLEVKGNRLKLRKQPGWIEVTLPLSTTCKFEKATREADGQTLRTDGALAQGLQHSAFENLTNRNVLARIETNPEGSEITRIQVFEQSFSAGLRKIEPGKITLGVAKGKAFKIVPVPEIFDLSPSCKVYQSRLDLETAISRNVEVPGGLDHPVFKTLDQRVLAVDVTTDAEAKVVTQIRISAFVDINAPVQLPIKPPVKVNPPPDKSDVLFSHKGRLDAKDALEQGKHFKVHTFKMVAGASYILELTSAQFETLLVVETAAKINLARGFDRGGGLGSRINFRANRNEEHRFIVTSLKPNATGDYTLRIRQMAAPVVPKGPNPALDKSVEVFSHKGQLDAKDPLLMGKHFKVHAFKMVAGATYIIDLKSAQFDTFLRLESAAKAILAQDDDGGGGLDSRIVFRAQRDEEYRIIVTSYPPNATGEYSLAIRQSLPADGPKSKGP